MIQLKTRLVNCLPVPQELENDALFLSTYHTKERASCCLETIFPAETKEEDTFHRWTNFESRWRGGKKWCCQQDCRSRSVAKWTVALIYIVSRDLYYALTLLAVVELSSSNYNEEHQWKWLQEFLTRDVALITDTFLKDLAISVSESPQWA